MKVKHIIVCGHYGCNGVKTALGHKHFGLVNKWLRNVKDVYRIHKHELDALPDPDRRFRKLVELNVQEQVWKLAETSFVQHAWKDEKRPTIHGWVYDSHTGYINDVAMLESGAPIDEIYRFVFDD